MYLTCADTAGFSAPRAVSGSRAVRSPPFIGCSTAAQVCSHGLSRLLYSTATAANLIGQLRVVYIKKVIDILLFFGEFYY